MSKSVNTQRQKAEAFDKLARMLCVNPDKQSVNVAFTNVVAVAKLAVGTPQFFNPLVAWEAERIRDRVLAAAGVEVLK